MKKQILVLMMVTFLVPFGAMAMDHSKMDHSGGMEKQDMDHSKMGHGGGMAMGGKMIMLQDVEVDEVMASAHMLDTKEKMAKHGMKETHHFMVGFMDTEGNTLDKGAVAVKIKGPDGVTSQPIRLMGMGSGFGADIVLDQKGTYMFMVGTKLADGKTRTFHLQHEMK